MERLEALWKRLNALRGFGERMGALSRLGRLGSIISYGMVWHGMYVSKHKHKEMFRIFGSVLERLEAFGKRLNAFRALGECLGAFGTLGRLVSIIQYVWYGMVWYVA